MTTKQQWLSAHLFYHEDLEPLLVSCVHPFIQDLQAQQAIERFFFIRYWQGGPHVRLRLLCHDETCREAIQRALEARVATFFRETPSKKPMPEDLYQRIRAALGTAESGQEDLTPLYADNSLRYIAYEPEYSRYGGTAAMPFVERYFMESSEIVLELLQKRLSRNQLTSQALAMLFLGMSIGGDMAILPQICASYFTWWSTAFGSGPAQTAAAFQRRYNRQRQTLLVLVKRLSEVVNQRAYTSDDPLLARWITAMRTLKEQLLQLEAQKLFTSDGPFLTPPSPDEVNAYPLLGSVCSCLHMHNNRLGITPLEEAYLAFLLQQTLTEIA